MCFSPSKTEVLLSDGATIDDPAAQDYAEGMFLGAKFPALKILPLVRCLRYLQQKAYSL